MRYLLMHKHDPRTEAGEKPSPELMAEMGAYIGEHAKRGTFLDGEGLGPSATRTRLRFREGVATVQHGPYQGEHELPASVLRITVADRQAAIGWAERYGKILGDGEIEIGPANEPWDLGMMPRPENPPLRALLIVKDGPVLTTKQKADLTRLKTEMTKAGVLTTDLALEPAAKARRLVFTNHDLRVLDGPFAESKELIGGFSVLKLNSMEEVLTEAKRFAAILGGTLEIDVRGIQEVL